MAAAAARPAAVGDGPLVLPPVPDRRRLGPHPRPAAGRRPRGRRKRADTVRRHHRQPVGEDDGKRGVHGYDAGKKINGRKRHIATDTMGFVIAIVVHAANIQDRDGAKLVMAKLLGWFPRLKLIWADGGYAGQLIEWAAAFGGWVLEIVKRTDDVKGFKLLPHRWVVERTFGWIGRYRRHSKDYEYLTDSSEAMIKISMINLMLHRLSPEKKPL